MDKKKKLQQKVFRQEEIMKLVKTEGRDLTAEEQRELDTLQREIDDLEREISQENGQGEETERQLQDEKKRTLDIMDMCRDFHISEKEQRKFIEGGSSVEAVKDAILDKLKKENGPISSRGMGDVSVFGASEDKYRAAAVDGMLMRGGISIEKPAEGAKEFQGMTLRDLAIETLQSEGESGLSRKSNDELFGMLMRGYFTPTAAFPAIMDNAIQKAYVEGHKTAPSTFENIVKKGSLNDFKTHDNNYIAGAAGDFLEVSENGELKHDEFHDEKKPTRKLKTYGRQFTLSRQAFINDDIGVITSLPAKYAAAARRTQNKQVYQIMINNPAIYDGTPLFSDAHKNIMKTGTGITTQAIQTMLMALQTQKNEFGEATIIRPGNIVVPIGMAFEISTILNSPTINTSDNTQAVNPLYAYRDIIKPIEDPTINALCGDFGNVMPWFMLANKADTDFIEIDYLNGNEIPIIQRATVPGQLGFIYDIYLDWGISVMDYRGAIKNPGIVLSAPLDM